MAKMAKRTDSPRRQKHRRVSHEAHPHDVLRESEERFRMPADDHKRSEQALRVSEEEFREMFNQTASGIAETDLTGRFVLVNERFCHITGLSREKLLTLRMHDITHPGDLSDNAEQFRALTEGGPNFFVEKRYLRPDSSVVWVHNDVSAIRDSEGNVHRVVAAVADITERVRAEEALRESEERLHQINVELAQRVNDLQRANADIRKSRSASLNLMEDAVRSRQVIERLNMELREGEERFRTLSEAVPTMVWICRPDGYLLHLNQRWVEYTGQTEKEYRGYGWAETMHPEDRPRILAQWKHCTDTGELYEGEVRYRRHDGQYRWHYFRGVPLSEGGHITAWYGTSLEIHEKKLLENELKVLNAKLEERVDERTTALRASLLEKEVLLKEIHHRVKNNLQIVSSLLDLQSEHTQDRQALEMFKESRNRVKSMALIHERFYRSKDLARVNFAEYIRQLADDLYDAYKVSSDEIVLDVDVDVPPLSIDVAIPCGLLLNELMTNCLKHAFKDVEQGRIRVSLCRSGEDISILTVADDGAGFPRDLDFRHTKSFGMQLVNTLVEQLHGEIQLMSNRETVFTITFPGKG